MKAAFRAIVACLAGIATTIFLFIPLSMFELGNFAILGNLAVIGCAGLAGWLTWKMLDSTSEGLAMYIVVGAAVLGGIGFCGGFFGPIIFAPEANQGPLLGIFITGPLGFALGALGGGVYWILRRKKIEQSTISQHKSEVRP